MYDPTPADDYVWPTCTACGRDLWVNEVGRYACRPCEDTTNRRLAELPLLFARLNTTAALMRDARRPGGGGSGTKSPPIPPRLDVLALIGPGGAAARLQAIEDSWRIALGRRVEVRSDGKRVFASWRSNPALAVPEHVDFLKINLRVACERYESVGQDVDDLRRLHAECTAVATDTRRPGRVQIGSCPTPTNDGYCGAPLTASAASHRIHCGDCGARWETLGEWRELRAAQEVAVTEAERQRHEGMAA